jgi:catechol 2,3-dioxygenase-like lactoylglutathione lyase family enzyme
MLQSLAAVTVLVPSYDDGLAFFRDILGFAVLEDTPLTPTKRWIVVAPSLGAGAALVLAVPSDERQRARVGDQTGGRVGYFLHSGDFWGDYENLLQRGVNFLETPRSEPYGLVAVFLDPWGGKWDLLQTVSEAAETP